MDRDMFAEADSMKKLRDGALQGERYIATNRFKVRDGQGPKVCDVQSTEASYQQHTRTNCAHTYLFMRIYI